MSFLLTVSPRPSAAAIDKAKSRLSQQLGLSKLLTEPDGLLAYAGDESENTPVLPDLVVLASSPEDIQHTLRIASEEGIFVTPRAGGSGKSGGAIPAGGGIVAPQPCAAWRRSIQAEARPTCFAGAWSWNRLCAGWRMSRLAMPRAPRRSSM